MTTINEIRSRVMKAAWRVFRNNNGKKLFSYCLKRAWELIKASCDYLAMKDSHSVCTISQEAYNSFYANTKYFGD